MFIVEFAGVVIITVLAVWFLASSAVKIHEKHVEWKYRLERKKIEDEQTDKLINGEK